MSDVAADREAAGVVATYRRRLAWRSAGIAALALAALAMLVADVVTGPSGLTVRQLLIGVLSPETLSRPQSVIVFGVRLPQACLAVLVGAALALAGAEMQTVLANPLASPFTLGISSAAALGAALGIVLGIGLPGLPATWAVPVNAFCLALLATAAVHVLSRLPGMGSDTLVLFGIATMFGANAGIALLQFVASAQTLQQLVFWTLGGLSRADWEKVAILTAVLALAAPFSLSASGDLNALRLGEERARTLGVEVNRLRFFALARISLLTASAVAFVGTIAFVGLVAPHIARLLVGEDHRFALPASALAGALLMSAAALASKLVAPGVVVPVGIVTSLVGVPVFLVLILSRWRRG